MLHSRAEGDKLKEKTEPKRRVGCFQTRPGITRLEMVFMANCQEQQVVADGRSTLGFVSFGVATCLKLAVRRSVDASHCSACVHICVFLSPLHVSCQIVMLLPAVDDEGALYPFLEECSALMPFCMQLGSHPAPH